MQWDIRKIELDKVPILMAQLEKNVKNGDPELENIRCVYKKVGDEVIYTLTPFDFIDLSPPPEISFFALSRMIRN